MDYRAVVDESTSSVNLYQHQQVVASVPCKLTADNWSRLLIGSENLAFSLWNCNGQWKMSLYKTDAKGFISLNGAVPVRVDAIRSIKPKPIL
jgi:hypothetical protein